MNKRELQKSKTRRLIMDTAYKIYSTEGFQATTNTIAKAANISHGTIFVHFPNVDSLLTSLLEEFGDTVNSQLHELSEKGEQLSDVLETHIDILSEYEDFYKNLIVSINLLPEEAKYTYISIQSTVSFHLSKVFERCVENKEAKDIPIHIVFNTWVGLLHYYLINRFLFTDAGSVLLRYKADLINYFMDLLKK